MKRIYIVVVNGKNISSTGYETDTEAIEFIENRSDNPEKISGWHYESERNTYKIHEVNVK